MKKIEFKTTGRWSKKDHILLNIHCPICEYNGDAEAIFINVLEDNGIMKSKVINVIICLNCNFTFERYHNQATQCDNYKYLITNDITTFIKNVTKFYKI